MSRNDLLQLTLKILWADWHLILREIQRHPWAVAVALYGLARAFGVMIQSGQRGVLFRWGKAVKELEPGFHWLIPLVHAVKNDARAIRHDPPPGSEGDDRGWVGLRRERERGLSGRGRNPGLDAGRPRRHRLPGRDPDRRRRSPPRPRPGPTRRARVARPRALRAHERLDRALGAGRRAGRIHDDRSDEGCAPDDPAPLPDDGARPGVARHDRRGPRRRIRPGDDRDRAPSGREVEPILPYPDTTTRPGDPRAREMQNTAVPAATAETEDAATSAKPTATTTATPTPTGPAAPRRRKG